MTAVFKQNNLPWVEKYRPENLDQINGHEIKIQTLKALIHRKELPHLLFYGSPGTGKTSTILACAIEMYGSQSYKRYVLELNASDDRGIDTVREQIRDFVKISSDKIKLVILDEADAMTGDAQNALKFVVEENSKNSRFCLICNDINKIIPGLQSRCTRMNFGTLLPEQIRPKIMEIISKEGTSISPEAIDRLIHINRDFRQIINTLQCIQCISESVIVPEDINSYLGIPTDQDIQYMVNLLSDKKKNFLEVSTILLNKFKDNQWSIKEFIIRIVRHVMSSKIVDTQKIKLIEKLADIDYKISSCHDIEIQLYSLVGAFQSCR